MSQSAAGVLSGNDNEDDSGSRMNVKDRIAALNGQTLLRPKTNTATTEDGGRLAPRQGTLRKTPSTSALLSVRQEEIERKNGSSSFDVAPKTLNASSPAPPLVPARPRSNTGADPASQPSSGRNSPKLDVKSIIALYGQQKDPPSRSSESKSQDDGLAAVRRKPVRRDLLEPSEDDGASRIPFSPPEVPTRPTNLISSNTPAAPAVTTAKARAPPPQLPPRARTGLLSSTDTGSSSSSRSSGTGSSHVSQPLSAAAKPLSYAPRKTPANASPSKTMTDPTWPTLPARNITNRPREGKVDDARLSSSLDADRPDRVANSRGTRTPPSGRPHAVPRPPPRNLAAASRQIDFGGSNALGNEQYPRSLPGSPRTQARPNASSTGRLTPQQPDRGEGRSPLTLSTSDSAGQLAPPPRHIDARRAVPGVAARRIPLHLSPQTKRRQRRKRRRDERSKMQFAVEPTEKERRRYTMLYQRLLMAQNPSGAEAVLGEQTVVRVWKRSKLDSWFLGQVWQQATQGELPDGEGGASNGGSGAGVDKLSFVRAMCAIDAELARRANV